MLREVLKRGSVFMLQYKYYMYLVARLSTFKIVSIWYNGKLNFFKIFFVHVFTNVNF